MAPGGDGVARALLLQRQRRLAVADGGVGDAKLVCAAKINEGINELGNEWVDKEIMYEGWNQRK